MYKILVCINCGFNADCQNARFSVKNSSGIKCVLLNVYRGGCVPGKNRVRNCGYLLGIGMEIGVGMG